LILPGGIIVLGACKHLSRPIAIVQVPLSTAATAVPVRHRAGFGHQPADPNDEPDPIR